MCKESHRDPIEARQDPIEAWQEARANASTVEEKTKYNVWDNLKRDVLPIIKASLTGKWSWHRNDRCKYIEVRIDMRTGACIIKDKDGNRINPEDLAYQHGGK